MKSNVSLKKHFHLYIQWPGKLSHSNTQYMDQWHPIISINFPISTVKIKGWVPGSWADMCGQSQDLGTNIIALSIAIFCYFFMSMFHIIVHIQYIYIILPVT